MSRIDFITARDFLLRENCKDLLNLEKLVTQTLVDTLLISAAKIKSDFDYAAKLRPFWEEYAPIQRGYKPRGEAFPWGEVGEKVIEGHLYSLAPSIFGNVQFIGLPYGHDIRFITENAFLHIDVKSTGPTDNPNELVCSPNQVSGSGNLSENERMFNKPENMIGPRVTRKFIPELAPFFLIDGRIYPTLTFYIKVVYSVLELGVQPLEYIELICVPNGLALFDGPNLAEQFNGLLTPGKDEQEVNRKRTRIKLGPLSKMDSWRCQKIKFDKESPYVEKRAP